MGNVCASTPPASAKPAVVVRIDVDTQVGFCNPEGHLYVEADETVLANVRELVAHAVETRLPLVGCVDSHSYDAWEFKENGGPFPPHCVKGTADWLKITGTLPAKFRFVPMSDGHLAIGENAEGGGARKYDAKTFSEEVRAGVGTYFEKEVYSAFFNPNCKPMLAQLVRDLGGAENVRFQVFGYCTGGYCVDAFAEGLADAGYYTEVVLDATAAIGAAEGLAKSKEALAAKGCKIISTKEALTS